MFFLLKSQNFSVHALFLSHFTNVSLHSQEYNADRLAKDYKLDLTDTKNVIEYFKTLKVVPMISEEAAERLREEEMEARALELLKEGKPTTTPELISPETKR